MIQLVNKILNLLRLRYSLYPIAAGFTGVIISQPKGEEQIVGTTVLVLLLWWGGMVTNHIFDYEIDKRALDMARENPHIYAASEKRPVANGSITRIGAALIAVIIYIGAFIISGLLGNDVFIACLIIAILTQMYNAYFKHQGILGTLLFASLISLTYLLGGLAGKQLNVLHFYAGVSSFLFHAGTHIFGSIKDYESDLVIGSMTFPVQVGLQKAGRVGAGLCIIGMISFTIPVILGLAETTVLLPISIAALLSGPLLVSAISYTTAQTGWEVLSRNAVSATVLYLAYATTAL
jgi:4-hydroxybenzoate polyprenyltransferase